MCVWGGGVGGGACVRVCVCVVCVCATVQSGNITGLDSDLGPTFRGGTSTDAVVCVEVGLVESQLFIL